MPIKNLFAALLIAVLVQGCTQTAVYANSTTYLPAVMRGVPGSRDPGCYFLGDVAHPAPKLKVWNVSTEKPINVYSYNGTEWEHYAVFTHDGYYSIAPGYHYQGVVFEGSSVTMICKNF